jgi:ribonucleoside-diphosphate reductase alpha chain
MDSVALLTSVALQYGVPLQNLVDKFRGVHFEPAGMTTNPQIPIATSLVDYIFRWLELRFLQPATPPALPTAKKSRAKSARATSDAESSAVAPVEPARDADPAPSTLQPPISSAPSQAAARPETSTGLACPDCGSILVFAEGCLVCRSCGYNKCG